MEQKRAKDVDFEVSHNKLMKIDTDPVAKHLENVLLKTVTKNREYKTSEDNQEFFGGDLICVEASQTVREAVRKMIKYRISSLPVIQRCQTPPGHFVGFVDMAELISYIAACAPGVSTGLPEVEVEEFVAKANAMLDSQLMTIIPHSHFCTPIHEGHSVHEAMQVFSGGVRRVPLFDDKRNLVGICSQSDVISYLNRTFQKTDHLSEVSKRQIDQYWPHTLPIGREKDLSLICIPPTLSALEATKRLALTGSRCLGITDPKSGKLIQHFSNTEIGNAIRKDPDKIFLHLLLPICDFLEQCCEKPVTSQVAVVNPSTSLGYCVQLMAQNHYHQVWLTKDFSDGTPLGLVNLTDVCQMVLHPPPQR